MLWLSVSPTRFWSREILARPTFHRLRIRSIPGDPEGIKWTISAIATPPPPEDFLAAISGSWTVQDRTAGYLLVIPDPLPAAWPPGERLPKQLSPRLRQIRDRFESEASSPCRSALAGMPGNNISGRISRNICGVALIYCVGLFPAQSLDADGYEAQRTARSITISAEASIPSSKWFRFLGRHFYYSSAMVSTSTKVVVNPLVWTPLFNVYFFAFHAILSGMVMTGVVERVKMNVPTSLQRSFLYWPFVTAFNLSHVIPQSRSVVTATCAALW
ncbi:uncharacterized protein Z520_07024 [Fonsecaea multimorphosa CBS 102226]|uniref:Uncharacterized protein n=1 Tax=Fonsecaea multimorphosa CBS 102226 TaxID=1442371 RepID=A0A0D2IKL7_9EURO|nr:uncharacterized protein Z520_07024 [Fonsecaea multimorphosa CBS 102226]KIX97571.1 hypothetical protein Z520_07024 [Fonsecaea multimorphosa CBS 102226]